MLIKPQNTVKHTVEVSEVLGTTRILYEVSMKFIGIKQIKTLAIKGFNGGLCITQAIRGDR